jgi:hypothetical protein
VRDEDLPPAYVEPEPMEAGLEKTHFFFKPSPVVFLGFLGFFFVVVFFYIFVRKGEFLGFFQFQEYF